MDGIFGNVIEGLSLGVGRVLERRSPGLGHVVEVFLVLLESFRIS